MVSLAPTLVKELVGDSPDETGMALARDCMASVPEATYRATMLALMGFDQRDALKNIAVPTLVLSGSKDKCAGADDGEDGNLHPLGKICRTRRRASRQSGAPRRLQCGAGSIPEGSK